jgi:nondiscriminating aspartyl-tRNA synthetase
MVIVSGWLENFKKISKNLSFLILRTPSTTDSIASKIQFICKDPSTISILQQIGRESFLEVSGVPEDIQVSKNLSYILESFRVLNPSMESEVGIDISKKEINANVDTKKSSIMLYRTEKEHRNLLVRNLVYTCIRKFLSERKVFELDNPKLTEGNAQSGAELFEVNFFDRKAYLSQSPQFNKQLAINKGLKAVYEIGPIYRAEAFKTTKHLFETICLDYQQITTNIKDLMDLIRDLLINVSEQLHRIYPDTRVLTLQDFITIRHEDALNLLGLKLQSTLGTIEEKDLVRLLDKEMVFVTNYPSHQRPFYTKNDESFDLLCPLYELASGSLRENNYDILSKKMGNIKDKDAIYYRESFKFGAPPTGGFGLGLDRLLGYFTKENNIRNTKFYSPL